MELPASGMITVNMNKLMIQELFVILKEKEELIKS